MRDTKARCQSIFTILFFIFYFNYIYLFVRISLYSGISCVFYDYPSQLQQPRNRVWPETLPTYVQMRVDARGVVGRWRRVLSLLYLLLFFSWRLNGSRFLIEKHAVNARRGRFYARKTGPRLLGREPSACKICMKFVVRTRRTFYGIIAATSLEFECDAHVNELQDGLRRQITVARAETGRSQNRNSTRNIRFVSFRRATLRDDNLLPNSTFRYWKNSSLILNNL